MPTMAILAIIRKSDYFPANTFATQPHTSTASKPPTIIQPASVFDAFTTAPHSPVSIGSPLFCHSPQCRRSAVPLRLEESGVCPEESACAQAAVSRRPFSACMVRSSAVHAHESLVASAVASPLDHCRRLAGMSSPLIFAPMQGMVDRSASQSPDAFGLASLVLLASAE